MIFTLLLGISLTGWISLVVALSTAIICAIMFMLGSERQHYVWGLFCAAVCVWVGVLFFLSQAVDAETALYWTSLGYVGAILIPIIYFYFALEALVDRAIAVDDFDPRKITLNP